MSDVQIVTASTQDHLRLFQGLFLEYAEELKFRLGRQDWETEPAKLPGQYAPPAGTILLALDKGHAIGCVALRRLEHGICEMKRLYVRPEHRRTGIGRHLAESAIEHARRLGYCRMRLDTERRMSAAIALYRSLGFLEIEPYTAEASPETIFCELDLIHGIQPLDLPQ